MNTIMYSCILLILILNQEVTSNPVDLNTRNESSVNRDNQRWLAIQTMQDTFHCLLRHYQKKLRLDIFERFGNLSQIDFSRCLRGRLRMIRIEKTHETSFETCYKAQYGEFEKTLSSIEVETNCLDMTNTKCHKLKSLMLSSRNSMDLCMKNYWQEIVSEVMDFIQSIKACILKIYRIETIPAQEMAKLRERSENLHYCAID